MAEKLTKAQEARVAAMKLLAAGIVDGKPKVELVGVFSDDHILGVIFTIDGTKVAWPWCGWEMVGAVSYADSPTAQIELAEYARCQIVDGEQKPIDDEEIADQADPTNWLRE